MTYCPNTGKVSYSEQDEARRAQESLRARSDRHPVDVYRCAMCGAWHLGRSRKGARP